MNNFDGKVVIVTGARTGIGLSAANLFAKAGAAVVLVGRHEPKKEAKNLAEQGYEAVSFEADVSKEADTKAMVDFTVKKFGHLDFAYNNAGIQSPVTKTEDLSLEEYDNVLNINLKGIFLSENYKNKLATCPKNKYEIYQCQKSAFLNSTETSE
ncbi:SDR family NAD(P)-dependent oxidoreductase [Companilactobacillus paralimentarius]|uniref:SDR family NAD(P)-dependent oxidoreductase n=1 Tax=Companilactobacillus paralimentarius TaxID=83526 RepID=UPI0028535F31|nr:SDR family NAD(P)-dependent oxidoreductase [Companilactobacillus paralimentarius]MDR4933871.1 SDR family NAD(P)-dependent oxidoreductase [Companilactobacillus paralimentarius]